MQQLLSVISKLDSTELSEIIQAIIRRYGEVHPDWEIFFLSLPRNSPEDRTKIINSAFDILKKH